MEIINKIYKLDSLWFTMLYISRVYMFRLLNTSNEFVGVVTNHIQSFTICIYTCLWLCSQSSNQCQFRSRFNDENKRFDSFFLHNISQTRCKQTHGHKLLVQLQLLVQVISIQNLMIAFCNALIIIYVDGCF